MRTDVARHGHQSESGASQARVSRRTSVTTHAWTSGMLIHSLVLGTVLGVQVTEAQEAKQPAIAPSSDLSSALSPTEWSRVEASVDAGLRWLATQQAADGRFPSKPVAQPAVTSLAIMALCAGKVNQAKPVLKQMNTIFVD